MSRFDKIHIDQLRIAFDKYKSFQESINQDYNFKQDSILTYSFEVPSLSLGSSEKRHAKKKVSIHKVEILFGTTRNSILNLLSYYDYHYSRSNCFELTYDEVQKLTTAFSKALKSEFKKVKKRSKHGISDQDVKSIQYYRRFIDNGYALTDREILSAAISDELIENWVNLKLFSFDQVTLYTESTSDQYLPNYVLKKLKYRVTNYNRDYRNTIGSYTVLYHYYVFPDEEEESPEKHCQVIGFSEFQSTSFRGSITVRSAIKLKSSEKNRTISPKYQSFQSFQKRQRGVDINPSGTKARYGSFYKNVSKFNTDWQNCA